MDFEEKQHLYRQFVEGAGMVVKGKSGYTSLNGHMYSFLGKDGTVAIRLSSEVKKAFEEEFKTGDVIQYNSVMRGYVPISNELLRDTDACMELLKKGHDYIASLKPKPTKKNS